jgi:hypothetical protein
MIDRNKIKLSCVLPASILAAWICACDPMFSNGSPEPSGSLFGDDTATWPGTFFRGARYLLPVSLSAEGSCALQAYVEDSLIYEMMGGRLAVIPLQANAAVSGRRLRIVASCGDKRDSLVKTLAAEPLSGFAPLESDTIRIYERNFESACATLYGGRRDSSRILLRPLGATGVEFRFERKEDGLSRFLRPGKADSVASFHKVDTFRLKMAGNVVVMREGTVWVEPSTDFPLLQDKIEGHLADDAGWKGPLAGYLGTLPPGATSTGWRARHDVGVGLVEYFESGMPSVCGASRLGVRLL